MEKYSLGSKTVLYTCAVATPIAGVPSLILYWLAVHAFSFLGINDSRHFAPEFSFSPIAVLGTVIFAPAIESLLLALGITLISKFANGRLTIAVISAFLWGAAHGSFGVLWFFGTVWTFFVFSFIYLTWKDFSLRKALICACVPHILINAISIMLIYMGR